MAHKGTWSDRYKNNMWKWGLGTPPLLKNRYQAAIYIKKKIDWLGENIPEGEQLQKAYRIIADLHSAAVASEIEVGLPENFTLHEMNRIATRLGLNLPKDAAMALASALFHGRARLRRRNPAGTRLRFPQGRADEPIV